eukprot:scaffold40836_cov45-Prasinocladus_malaysianus.AAC.1
MDDSDLFFRGLMCRSHKSIEPGMLGARSLCIRSDTQYIAKVKCLQLRIIDQRRIMYRRMPYSPERYIINDYEAPACRQQCLTQQNDNNSSTISTATVKEVDLEKQQWTQP